MRKFFMQLFKKKDKVYCRECYYFSKNTEHAMVNAPSRELITCDKVIKQKEKKSPLNYYLEDIYAQCYRENRSNHCKYYKLKSKQEVQTV